MPIERPFPSSIALALPGVLGLTAASPTMAAPSLDTLYTFKETSTGGHPLGALIRDGSGALYGTTSVGGSGLEGSVIRLTPPAAGHTAWDLSVLHGFQLGDLTGGALPYGGLLMDKTGALYGATTAGGKYDAGVVFKLTRPAAGHTVWDESVLYTFTGQTDGGYPTDSLIMDKDGALYGTAMDYGGPSGGGVVFELAPPPKGGSVWRQTVLYRFTNGKDGGRPGGGLVMDAAGALYGTTGAGGATTGICSGAGCGVVFKLTPPAKGHTVWKESVLLTFAPGASGYEPGATGDFPYFVTLIIDRSGALYGTTYEGGRYDGGVAFKLAPPAAGHNVWKETILHDFAGGADGSYPYAGLAMDSAGAVYGTTQAGGTNDEGTVFKLAPPAAGHTVWTETVLHGFADGKDGYFPYTGVTLDPAGHVFGTTYGDAGSQYGTVFEVTP